MRKLTAVLVVFPVLFAVAAFAQGPTVLYDNGQMCPGGCFAAWQINDGHVVTDSFFVNTNVRVTGFDLRVWEFPGDKVLRVQWAISSDPFGGTIYGSGSTPASDTFLWQNEYGYYMDRVTVSGLNIVLPSGSYWLTVQNVLDVQHVQVYWDENQGRFCHSLGCPSSASENQVGTIPSETFDVRGVHLPGADDQSKVPTSSLILGPMLIGLVAGVRRFVG